MALMAHARHLYILVRKDQTLFLAPGPDGIPEPATDAIPLQAEYVSDAPDLDQRVRIAAERLPGSGNLLLVPVASPDGPPHRSVVIFCHSADLPSQVVIVDQQTKRSMRAPVSRYSAVSAGVGEPWAWNTDVQQGRPGFFVTGPGRGTSLFRVARAEVDAIGRALLTLTPVRFATGLPRADFSAIKDTRLRAEVEGAYRELELAVAGHQVRSVVTRAKDVVEGVLGSLLAEQGLPVPRDLSKRLTAIGERMDEKGEGTLGLTRLELYLTHKIRILHARTHPTAAGRPAVPLSPELGLTVVEDLAQILRQLGMTR